MSRRDIPCDPHEPGRKRPVYLSAMQRFRFLHPGHAEVYHVEPGPVARCHGTFAAAWDAMEQGLVSLCQRRPTPGGPLEYLAVRL